MTTATAGSAQVGKTGILVIGDALDFRRSANEILAGLKWEVRTAVDCRDGLSRLETETFAVVILDLGPQPAVGLELFQQIRTWAPATPVIAITPDSSLAFVIQAMHAGVFECLAKPLSANALQNAVTAAVQASSGNVAGGSPFPQTASGPGRSAAIRVKPELCWGCLSCTVACSYANLGLAENVPMKTAMLSAARLSVEAAGGYAIPLLCMQCADAPCMSVCPAKALQRTDRNSPITADPTRCVGCRRCHLACPLGVLTLDAEHRIIQKCDMCVRRTRAGHLPACVECCPMGALELVPATGEAEAVAADAGNSGAIPRW